MGNHHSHDKKSHAISGESKATTTHPTTTTTLTTTIITDGSFKTRRRSHNRKSKSKESPHKFDHAVIVHRLVVVDYILL